MYVYGRRGYDGEQQGKNQRCSIRDSSLLTTAALDSPYFAECDTTETTLILKPALPRASTYGPDVMQAVVRTDS